MRHILAVALLIVLNASSAQAGIRIENPPAPPAPPVTGEQTVVDSNVVISAIVVALRSLECLAPLFSVSDTPPMEISASP